MSFYYKKLSASFSFRYSLGKETMASALYDKVENITQDNIGRNQDKRALYDRWKKPGDKAKFKAIDDYSSTADVFPFRGDGEHFFPVNPFQSVTIWMLHGCG